MIPFPHYSIEEKLYESNKTVVYRVSGGDGTSSEKMIIKLLKKEFPAPWEMTEMMHEYHTLNSLNIPGVIRIRKLERLNQRLGIVMEDIGGTSLDRQIPETGLDIETFGLIAQKTASVLSGLHRAGYIHKDINPSNFIYNPDTGELRLIDFGIASPFMSEHPDILNTNMVEGTIHYISPEQTGRMNRLVDYRSDFYSLGITFYEMLTGQLPYDGADPMEIAYRHLSGTPDSKMLIERNVPVAVQEIILKLIQRNPEDRYQSLRGLKEDLSRIAGKKRVRPFAIATYDVADQFLPSGEIVGRSDELQILQNAFRNAADGAIEWVSIKGKDGFGRSALINSIHDTILKHRGFFIPVKFDRTKSDIPHYSITLAFQKVMRQLLLEKDYKIGQWRDVFTEKLGKNAGIMCNIMPGLDRMLEDVPDTPTLPAEQSSFRFNRVFADFITAFCSSEHPLVLFLDDVQWMDNPTIGLLEYLLTTTGVSHLNIVATYNGDAGGGGFDPEEWMMKIRSLDIHFSEIAAGPLQFEDVRQLIVTTLHHTGIRVRELTHLIYERIGGNPLLVLNYLQYLNEIGTIRFDTELGKWAWDIKEIRDGTYPKSIGEMVSARINQLPESEKTILEWAACIGFEFDLQTLSTASEMRIAELIPFIRNAIIAGFITPLEGAYRLVEEMEEHQSRFRFTHDCVYRTVYDLLSEESKCSYHYAIGNQILKASQATEWDERIFFITHHLNLGRSLIPDMSGRFDLADLNLIAGRKARISGAYEAGYRSLMTAVELIHSDPEINPWDIHYELALSVYSESVEAAYLSENYGSIKEIIAKVSHYADNYLDEIPLYLVRIKGDIRRGEFVKAVRYAGAILQQLGLELSDRIGRLAVNRVFNKLQRLLSLNKNSEPDDLPDMHDPFKLMEMRVLDTAQSALMETVKNSDLYIIFLKVLYTLEYGNCPESVFAYLDYARYLCSEMNDLENAYRFGNYALNLIEKKGYHHLKAKAIFGVGYYIRHWKNPIRDVVCELDKASRYGFDNGDPATAFQAIYARILYGFFSGEPLSALLKRANDILNVIRFYRYPLVEAKLKTFRSTIDAIYSLFAVGQTDHPSEITHPECLFDQALLGMIKTLFIEDRPAAADYIRIAESHAHEMSGSYGYVLFYAFRALHYLSAFYDYTSREKKRKRRLIMKDYQRLERWNRVASPNIRFYLGIIEAEIARINGEDWKAMDLFDRIIAQCEESGFVFLAAMSYEWTARFYIEHNKQKIAAVYLEDAYRLYGDWEAGAKLAQMREKYGDLIG